MGERDFRWIIILVIAAAVYLNVFANGFVFDDLPIIRDNSEIRSLKNIPGFFVTQYWGKEDEKNRLYRPLVISSYAGDYFFFGDRPAGYHALNLLLHALNSLLIFFLFLSIMRPGSGEGSGRWWAFAAALIFAVHPVHTDAVTALVGRAELIAAFFTMSAFLFYLRFREHGRGRDSLLVLIFFFLALPGKENAIVLPLLILVYDLLYVSPFRGQHFFRYARLYPGLFCTAVLYMLIRFLVLGGIGPAAGGAIFSDASFLTRMATMVKVFATYLKLLVFPVGLRAFYDDTFPFSDSFLDARVLLSAAVLAATIGTALYLCRKRSKLAFPLLWIFLCLLPVSQIIPLGALMAERFLYLPSAGFSLFTAGLLQAFWLRRRKRFTLSIALASFLFVVLMIWGVMTVKRNRVWKDSAIFWSTLIRDYPESAVGHYNMGVVRMMAEDREGAIASFRRATELGPSFYMPYYNLGVLYEEEGNLTGAVAAFQKSRELAPSLSGTAFRLGKVYLKSGAYGNAVKTFRWFVSKHEENGMGWYYLGEALAGHGDVRAAEEAFRRAIRLDSGECRFYTGLARALEMGGRADSALAQYRAALDCGEKPDRVVPAIGRALYRLGRKEEARQFLERHLRDETLKEETREEINELLRYFGRG